MTGEVKLIQPIVRTTSVCDLHVCVGVISHGNYRSWNIWQQESALLFWDIPEQYILDIKAVTAERGS